MLVAEHKANGEHPELPEVVAKGRGRTSVLWSEGRAHPNTRAQEESLKRRMNDTSTALKTLQ